MLSFTPKNSDMTVVKDRTYYSTDDGIIKEVYCYSYLKSEYKKSPNLQWFKVWVPIIMPFREGDQIVCDYIQWIKDLGGFDGTFDTQYEYKEDKFYLTFKINPKTYSYRRLLLLGSMLRGVSQFWYIAVFWTHFKKLYPDGPLLNMFVLAHAKFDHKFVHAPYVQHCMGHGMFYGETVMEHSKKKLTNPFLNIPSVSDRGLREESVDRLGTAFNPDIISRYPNYITYKLSEFNAFVLKEMFNGL